VLDQSENFVDWLLPVEKQEGTKKNSDLSAFIRVVNIPMQIPMRISRIIVIKVEHVMASASTRYHIVVEACLEKRDQAIKLVSNTSRQILDKANSAAEPSLLALQNRKAATRQQAEAAITWMGDGVWMIAEKAQLPAAKIWTLERADGAAVQAFAVFASLAGEQRASSAFARVGNYIPAAKHALEKKLE